MKKWFLLVSIGIMGAVHAADEAYVWENALTLESVHNFSGGIDEESAELANLDVTLAIDTATAGWWENGEVFIYALGDYGKDPAELTGGVQGTSNIAADDAIKIYEFWYQHSFADDSFKILTGLHDFNSTFYSLDSAGLFNHPSFGIGLDTSQATPSIFPTTAWTLHATVTADQYYFLAAIYDGVPGHRENPRGTHIRFNSGDGTFNAIETGFSQEENYKIGLGYWRLTAEVENPVDQQMIDQNSGIYLIAEKTLSANVSMFIQLGSADDKTNQIAEYFGAGLVRSNFFKDGDAIGIAIANVKNGDPFREANPGLLSGETAYEVSYNFPISEAVATQFSLYHIKNPDMDSTLDDAFAAGMRLVFSF